MTKRYVIERRRVFAERTEVSWFVGSSREEAISLSFGGYWWGSREDALALSFKDACVTIRNLRDNASAFGDYHIFYYSHQEAK